jgi:hypothetical protein
VFEEQAAHGQDRLGNPRHQRKAVARIADRRCQHLAQRPRAVLAQHGEPRGERPRHRRTQQADARNLLETEAAKGRGAGLGRRATLSADGVHAPLALAPQQDRRFAAGAVEVRLHHLQHKARCNRGVEGVAAAFEHAHRGLRGQPVGR